MSETPNNPAGHMTERIMAAIRGDIKVTESDVPPFNEEISAIHYNHAYETVYAILSEIPVTRVEGGPKTCGKLVGRKGSIRQCALLKHHAGQCEPKR